MKEIPLTRGKVALVDDADYEGLNQWKWHAVWNPHTRTFYAMRTVALPTGRSGRKIEMHRVILGLMHGDRRQGDHQNHDTLDNQRFNLRIVTNQENQWNRISSRGYHWHYGAGKYAAEIMVNRKHIHLGLFRRRKDARQAYLIAKSLYHQNQENGKGVSHGRERSC